MLFRAQFSRAGRACGTATFGAASTLAAESYAGLFRSYFNADSFVFIPVMDKFPKPPQFPLELES